MHVLPAWPRQACILFLVLSWSQWQRHEVLERNVLTSAELKRRGIAAIEQALQHGPVHLIKHNQEAGVVLSEHQYRQLQLQASRAATAEPSTLNWLLNLPPAPSPRSKTSIDADLAAERDW